MPQNFLTPDHGNPAMLEMTRNSTPRAPQVKVKNLLMNSLWKFILFIFKFLQTYLQGCVQKNNTTDGYPQPCVYTLRLTLCVAS